MLKRDYLMRMIEDFGTVLTHIISLRQNKQASQALKEVEQACQKYCGISFDVVDVASTDNLVSLLKMGGPLDGRRALFLAELLLEQGEIYESAGEPFRAYWAETRSLGLLLEVLMDPGFRTPDNLERVTLLLQKLAAFEFALDLEARLFRFYSSSGRFAKAEDALHRLVSQDPVNWLGPAIDYYRDLSTRSDEELNAGGLPREEVVEALGRLERHRV